MPDGNITKKALAASLKGLLESRPLSKISVGDICEGCRMNRKSFYYHFRDKYDLVDWIFDTEFLDWTSAREFTGIWDFVGDLCAYLYENRSFYRRVLREQGQNSFADHFWEMMRTVISAYLGDIFAGEEHFDLLVAFFADANVCAMARWLLDRDPIPPEAFLHFLRVSVLGAMEKFLRDAKDESNESK